MAQDLTSFLVSLRDAYGLKRGTALVVAAMLRRPGVVWTPSMFEDLVDRVEEHELTLCGLRDRIRTARSALPAGSIRCVRGTGYTIDPTPAKVIQGAMDQITME